MEILRRRFDKTFLLTIFEALSTLEPSGATLSGVGGFALSAYTGRWTEKTSIEYICNCGNTGSKTFRNLCDTGAFCKGCMKDRQTTSAQIAKKKNLPIEKAFISHPQFKFFDYELNPGIEPRQITIQSGISLTLKCPDCLHVFSGSPHGLKNCRFCTHQALCTNDDCIRCFNNSLASRHFAGIEQYKEFNYLLANGKMYDTLTKLFLNACAIYDFQYNTDTCRSIFKSSSLTECTFICHNCKHSFLSQPSRVESLSYCPYCSPNAKILCPKDKNCSRCFERSFASHPTSKFWDYSEGKNDGKTPYDVFKSGTHIADIICGECNHSFQMCCNSISTGFWCPYCACSKRCSAVDCTTCNSRKLSSHPMAEYWDYLLNPADITPADISLGNSRIPFWFKCPAGKHSSFKKRASKIKGGCPACTHKTEAKLMTFLKKHFPSVMRQFTVEWLRNPTTGNLRKFDFYIPELNRIIELDGRQHFKQVWNWITPDSQAKIDVWKMKQANNNGISIIRILQEEVFVNDEEWLEQNLLPELIPWPEVSNLFIADEEKLQLYDLHESLLAASDECIDMGIDDDSASEHEDDGTAAGGAGV
jgi:very-short-patch-repair endonuclease